MHDFQHIAEPALTQAAAAAEVVKIKPQAAWDYMHHPLGWEVKDGEYLPILKRFKHVPGVNGVGSGGRSGEVARVGAARADFESKGWRFLPHNCVPQELCNDGLPSRDYMIKYPGYKGAVHLVRWDHPKRLGDKHVIRTDDAGMLAFRRYVRDAGLVDPIDDEVKDMLQDRLHNRRQRHERSAAQGMPRAQQIVTEVDGALAALGGRRVEIEAKQIEKPKRREAANG